MYAVNNYTHNFIVVVIVTHDIYYPNFKHIFSRFHFEVHLSNIHVMLENKTAFSLRKENLLTWKKNFI